MNLTIENILINGYCSDINNNQIQDIKDIDKITYIQLNNFRLDSIPEIRIIFK